MLETERGVNRPTPWVDLAFFVSDFLFALEKYGIGRFGIMSSQAFGIYPSTVGSSGMD